MFAWAACTVFIQFYLIPRLLPWPSLSAVIPSLLLYVILAMTLMAFLRSLRVWRSSLASRYEQQCQKMLRQFNLQLCDGATEPFVRPSTPTVPPGSGGNATPPPGLSGGLEHAAGHGSSSAGYHLAFVRRMPRRLLAFLETYREEYRARRKYCLHGVPPSNKKNL